MQKASPSIRSQESADPTTMSPDRARVAKRAYELYLARGGGDGQAMDDWLAAERELLVPAPSQNRPDEA